MKWRWILALLLLAVNGVGGGSLAEGAGSLSQEEARGKRIFREGRSEAGRMITAKVGRSGMAMPGKSFPCAGCHGSDGRGRSEGGVVPADITWSRLAQPLGATLGGERSRSAYDARSLAAAITAGLNPDGHKLDVTMPRFDMDREDLADLIAYLHRLEQDLDQGVTERTVTVGTLVPKGDSPDSVGPVVASVIRGYVEDVNEGGGIYGRRIELMVMEAATRDQAVRHLAELSGSVEVFALVGAVTAGVEREMDRVTEQHQLPLIGPLTQFPHDEESLQRHTFYLFGGLSTQGRALIEFASRTWAGTVFRLGIVHPQGESMAAIADSISRDASSRRWDAPVVLDYPQGSFHADETVRRLRLEKVNAVLFVGNDGELNELAQVAVREGWSPFLLVPAFSVGPALFEVPTAFDGRMFAAFPNAPSDQTAGGIAEFSAFRAKHRLSNRHLAAQLSSYASVKILVEGLKRTGAKLSRERFLDALEQLYDFRTGLTPPVMYGPNRRVGAAGAHVIGVDVANKRFISNSKWIPVQ